MGHSPTHLNSYDALQGSLPNHLIENHTVVTPYFVLAIIHITL